MRCPSYTRRRKLSSPSVLNLVSRLLIDEVPGGCERCKQGRSVLINQQNAGYESNRRNSSIDIPSARQHLHSLCLAYLAHRQHPQLSRHHVTCAKQCLLFQNTPDNLQNFVHSLWVCLRYMQMYHNANAWEVDSFSTHSDGTRGEPQRRGKGNCQGNNADMSHKSTPVVGSGPYKGFHFGSHLWTHTDIQCLRSQG